MVFSRRVGLVTAGAVVAVGSGGSLRRVGCHRDGDGDDDHARMTLRVSCDLGVPTNEAYARYDGVWAGREGVLVVLLLALFKRR